MVVNSLKTFSDVGAIKPYVKGARAVVIKGLLTGDKATDLFFDGDEFIEFAAKSERDLRELLNVPSNYKVLFLQGGASTQFAMVPMNLLSPGGTADYIDGGSWADKAAKEAKKIGTTNIAASTKSENYARIPRQDELKLTPRAAYVHMTSNNTIEGTQFRDLPEVGDAPLVSDTSSDMFSRPIDIGRHALVYAGAQKNIGPAGLTIVIVRDDLLGQVDWLVEVKQAGAVGLEHRRQLLLLGDAVDDLARACVAALLRGRPQRVVQAADFTELKMGEYFDLAADYGDVLANAFRGTKTRFCVVLPPC